MKIALVLVAIVPSIVSAQTVRAERWPSGEPITPMDSQGELALVRIGLAMRVGHVPAAEREGLSEAMEAAYASMHERHGTLPSILVASHQRPQSADAFDVLTVEPPTTPRFGVVFLHGYGGASTWACMAIAEVVSDAGGRTVCPTDGPEGHWWQSGSKAIVDASIRRLREQGIDRVILAGLSNGAVGASRIAARLQIDGLVLVSGASASATRARALLIHGASNRMASVASARAFARRSPHSRLHVLDGDHFLLADDTAQVQALLAAWLRETSDG
jgi:pimeloyl-ACP methyl ester carboxylesterase